MAWNLYTSWCSSNGTPFFLPLITATMNLGLFCSSISIFPSLPHIFHLSLSSISAVNSFQKYFVKCACFQVFEKRWTSMLNGQPPSGKYTVPETWTTSTLFENHYFRTMPPSQLTQHEYDYGVRTSAQINTFPTVSAWKNWISVVIKLPIKPLLSAKIKLRLWTRLLHRWSLNSARRLTISTSRWHHRVQKSSCVSERASFACRPGGLTHELLSNSNSCSFASLDRFAFKHQKLKRGHNNNRIIHAHCYFFRGTCRPLDSLKATFQGSIATSLGSDGNPIFCSWPPLRRSHFLVRYLTPSPQSGLLVKSCLHYLKTFVSPTFLDSTFRANFYRFFYCSAMRRYHSTFTKNIPHITWLILISMCLFKVFHPKNVNLSVVMTSSTKRRILSTLLFWLS